MRNSTPTPVLFKYQEHDVRTIADESDVIWFYGKDVADSLEFSWHGQRTMENIPDDWFMVASYATIKGDREIVFITEPAVYQMTFRSQKPEAVKFARWVFEEVLPSIRKTGRYGIKSGSPCTTKRRYCWSNTVESRSTPICSISSKIPDSIKAAEIAGPYRLSLTA